MDASKFLFPANKKLDISGLAGEGDFVTLKVIPIAIRYQINRAKTKGIDWQKVREILQDETKFTLTDDDIQKIMASGRIKEVFTSEYDSGIEAQILTLNVAVDPDNHSFVDAGGKPVKLDRAFWEGLGAVKPKLFEFIYDELIKYQGEMALGESTGNR